MKTNILINIRVLAILVACLTMLGIGNAWGADELYATITFLDNGTATDGSSAFTNKTNPADVLSPSSSVSGFFAAAYVYQAQDEYGWKFGSSSYNGDITLTLASTISNVKKIVVNAKKYNSTKATTINCNSKGAQSLTNSFADYEFTYASATSVSSIQLVSNRPTSSDDRRCYVKYIKIYVEPSGYAVTYNNGGHGVAPSNTTATSVTLAAITGVTGYTCTGWKANVTVTVGGVSKSAGTLLTNGSTATLSAATTFTAQWEAKTTTVSFNQNGGTGGQTTSKTATYDAAMPTPITCPTREHYDFGGYYDGAGGTGTQYYTNTGASARSWNKDAASATLYAKWTEHSLINYRTLCCTEYDITLANSGSKTGGTFEVDPASACEGTEITLIATPATGYEFTGWTVTNDDDDDEDVTTTVLGSGNEDEDAVEFEMPAYNITIDAAFACIEPTISAQSSDANYFVDDSPTALSVTASAGTGSLGYLWKVSTNGGSTWSNASGTNNTASYSGASLSTASAATLKFKCVVTNTSASCSTESDVVTIVVREASCSGFSFHYGTDGEDDWEIACFGDAVSNVRTIEDFQIPSATHFYVGYQGTYTSGSSSDTDKPNSSTLTWSSLYFDASIGDGSRPMVGQATGATGTVKIIDNSNWTNKKASFIPDGYKLKFGSSTYSDFVQYNGHEYRSGLVEYSSSSAEYGVSVGIINANDDNSYVSTANSDAMRHIFLNTGGTTYWSTGNATNFAIYDDTDGHKYFTCLMVKVPGEDYLYEGWVPTTCTKIIFCRMASGTLEWGAGNANVWNYVESQSLPSGKNLFTISAWSTGSWSAYTQKGQFRINEDWTDKNWYVRFVPSYVLSFDANGGEGAPDAQYVAVDADPCQITVSTSEPTRTGYTFVGWNESSSAASKDDDWDGGDTHDMDGDVTLYAVWSANTISLTLDKNNSDASGSSNGSGSIKYDATTKTSITAATRTGYNVEGYYAEAGGTNKVLTASGDVVNSTVSGYTTSGKWTRTTTPTTLYTKWTAKTTTVSFNQNSGTGGQTTTKTATYASAMPTPITLPTREGHTFGGYYESAGGTGAQYYTNTGASAKNWDKEDATWTLYAKWTVNNYTLTWNWDGGSTSSTTHTAAGSVAYGTTLVYPANNTMSKTGYTFTGWSSTPSTMPAANTTITAQWSVNNYNVAVLANSNVTITATPSGSSAIAESGNANVNYGTTVTLNCSSITSGMTWGGWKVYKADDASTTVTVSGTGNGATFTMPAYAVKVEAFIYSAGIAWCDPEIEVTGDVHLTSYKDIPVNSTSGASNLISISSSDFGSATRLDVAYLDADNADAEVDKAESVFRLCNDGSVNYNTVDGFDLDYEWGTTHSIKYTPNAYNQRDNYKLQFTLKRGDKVLKTVTHNIYGRALPEEFVIASKYKGEWYALPNTIGASAQDVTPLKITVDNTTTPTEAAYAPSTTAYKGAARYREGNNVNAIRFTVTGSNWLETGSTSQLKLSTTAAPTVDVEAKQAWYLKSSDFGAYELSISSKKLGIYNDKIGMFATPTSPSGDIYLLPITNKFTPRAATVKEWGEHGVIVEADMTNVASATINIDGASPTSTTLTAVNGTLGSTKNVRIDAGALTVGAIANDGKQLYIHWKNSGGTEIATSQVEIPCVIAEDGAMKTLDGSKDNWAKKEVHVLPGVTLEANAGSFGSSAVTIPTLHIYPGATLNVSSGTLTTTTLRLHNGWTRAGEKQYNVARVYINATNHAALVKTTASIDYDIYEQSDGKHYYPLAVPFTTPVSSIDYADTYLAGFSNYGASGQYVIKTYDGAARAEGGGDSNWTVVDADKSLKPGVGYIMTAVAVKGEAIIRIPLDFNNAWTSDGEKATANYDDADHTKNVVAVEAYTGTAAESNPRHAGWNMLGVPFMSCYATDESMHSQTDGFITGKMTLTGDPSDPYGGYDDGVIYVTVPTHDFSEYIQEAIDDTELLPGWSFFIQAAKDGNLTFAVSSQQPGSDLPIYAPNRMTNENPVLKTGIILSNTEKSDKTTIIVSDRYSSEYEIGADLEKMFGEGYTLATYSLSGSTRLAFNAMNRTDAQQVIPIGFRAPADGEYTFSLNQRYDTGAMERVDLIDYQTGTLTNLLHEDYTFTTSRTQDDSRFALNVKPAPRVPTSVETGEVGDVDLKVEKVIIDDKMYIIYDKKMYDVTGKRVYTINK